MSGLLVDIPGYPQEAVWWQLRVLFLCGSFIAVFLLELLVDSRFGKKSIGSYIRPSTCLLMGATVRDLGETRLVRVARAIACIFIHAHFIHLFSNVLSAVTGWYYFVAVEQLNPEQVWVHCYVLPCFVAAGMCGSWVSYHTSLRRFGFSVGASGGTQGLTGSFLLSALLIEGLPRHRRQWFMISLAIMLFNCIPWDWLYGDSGDGRKDYGAHLAGTAVGGMFAAMGRVAFLYSSTETMIRVGNIATAVSLILICLAALEVLREYLVDGTELVVRAYIKLFWLDESLLGEDSRRHTSPGRLNCDVLTEEYLYLLQNELIEDDPELILARLEEEKEDYEKGPRIRSSPSLGGYVY